MSFSIDDFSPAHPLTQCSTSLCTNCKALSRVDLPHRQHLALRHSSSLEVSLASSCGALQVSRGHPLILDHLSNSWLSSFCCRWSCIFRLWTSIHFAPCEHLNASTRSRWGRCEHHEAFPFSSLENVPRSKDTRCLRTKSAPRGVFLEQPHDV